MPTNWVFSY